MTPVDQPMSLGDHLEELRRRLMRILIVVVLAMVGAMFFSQYTLQMVLQPLYSAAEMIDDETLSNLRVDNRGELTTLHNKNLTEGPVSIIRIAFYVAIVVAVPMILYELWGFVTPGLTRNERRFAFMLLPLAVIFFYGGLLLGYLYGLPYLYRFIIEFNANWNPGVKYIISQAEYYNFFFVMCILFGFLMDVPWAVMLLVKTGIVTPDQLAAKRRIIYFVAIICSAVLTPPDPYSQMMMWCLAAVLFESGLLASRIFFKTTMLEDLMSEEDDDPAAIAAMAGGASAAEAARQSPPVTPEQGASDGHEDHDDYDHDDLHHDYHEDDYHHPDHEYYHPDHADLDHAGLDGEDGEDGPIARRTGWDGPEQSAEDDDASDGPAGDDADSKEPS